MKYLVCRQLLNDALLPLLNWMIKWITTYCVLRVNAADVIEDGNPRPLMTSCHNFLLITSTKPPLATTRLYNSYKSNTCLAIIGNRLIGVPEMIKSSKIIDRGNSGWSLDWRWCLKCQRVYSFQSVTLTVSLLCSKGIKSVIISVVNHANGSSHPL